MMGRLCISIGLGLLSAAVASPAAANPPWNILLLVAEDLSPRLGAYGDPVAHTPNLDRLAAEGARYTRAFTTSGVCAPSRAAIIMGVHQNHWGAGHMRAYGGGDYLAVPPPSWKAFPELLRAQGYYVVNNGKTDYQMGTVLGGAYGGPASIWDEERGDDWRGRAEDQPFFAYITFLSTHESQVWPTWDVFGLEKFFMAFLRIPLHLGWEHETDPAQIALPPYYPDTPTVRADMVRHYNNIAAMDAQVGEVLEKLEEDGVADRTIVIFTTDHGDGLPRAKRWLYDSGIHVPLMVRWPGQTSAGAVVGELVSGVDLAPTILAAAGVPRPDYMEGRVFVGPGREAEPDYVFAARDRMDESVDRVRSVRDRRFKYIRHLLPDQPYVLEQSFRDQMPMMQEFRELARDDALSEEASLWFRGKRDAEELFDTVADPHEILNLASDPKYAEVMERMRAQLDRRLSNGRDLGLLPESEIKERFWPGGEQPTTRAPVIVEADRALRISSDTAGASILWQRSGDDEWKLYTEPLRITGAPKIRAKAVRYGYAESETTSFP